MDSLSGRATVALIALALADAHGVAAPFAEVASRDAELRDLEFLDARHGFAVGDRGVVLRTDDAGRSWTRLDTPIDCPLHGVSFIDRAQGWVVGGFGKPYGDSTRGVVLRTDDGGATWQRLPDPMLPLLCWVRFFDEQNGVAVGAGESFHPSGVFITGDGGRSWQPLPGDRPRHWRAADFFSPQIGVTAGARGTLGLIAKHDVKPIGATAGDRRGYHAVRVSGPTTGWLVGDGGAVLRTDDAGRTWVPPAGQLPLELGDRFDWRSVSTQGDQVWIAGAPGAVVLHSPDAGRSWHLQPTGVPLPLHAIEFVDHQHGWAAGALGTLLATTDGGRTWRVQRRGGERMAIDVLLADRQDTPVELLAKLGAVEGYLSSVGVMFGDEADRSLASNEARIEQSTTASGGAHGSVDWRLPLTASDRQLTADQLLNALNQKTDNRTQQELQQALVTRLRRLRPSAVVLADPGSSHSAGAAELLRDAVEQAVRDSADPTVLPELAKLGVGPWRVERVVQIAADGLRSTGGFSTGDFEPQLGTSITQWASGPRRLVQVAYAAPPSRIGWQTIAGNAAGGARRDDLLAGISLLRGGEARRASSTPPPGNLDQLRSTARKRRNMQQLLAHKQGDSAWVGQVVNLTGGLDPDSGAELLYQLAIGYRDAGKLDLAADTFYLLAKRYTDHPLCEPSLTWLLRYYASSEMAVYSAATATSLREPKPLANVTSEGIGSLSANEDPSGVLTDDDRFERATRLAAYLRDAHPALYADPAVRFPVVAAKRRLGYEKDAERILLLMGKQAIDPAWRRCTDAERWLAKPTGLPPQKPIAVCKSVAERPYLDGKLDDACWSDAERIPLAASRDAADDAGWLQFIRDDEFLCFAIDCPLRDGLTYEPPVSRRSRDADLTASDRVTLRFDTDRDYTTALELSIDAQGRPADRIVGGPNWRHRGWNPTWYVAARHEGGRWRVEVAAPFNQLTARPPTPRDVWAVGVVRQTPNSGTQETWTGAAPGTPDHYGLLLMK